jgi:NRAMP (natural resistance-associated macrophage protein)-like metal ion transporter
MKRISHDAEMPATDNVPQLGGSSDCELQRLRASTGTLATSSSSSGDSRMKSFFLSALGPGLLVCLADTDAGCLIVAGQSGAKYGYSLLSLQFVLIPVLYLAQELTVRLGIQMKQGHTACVRKQFGSVWAWISCSLLVISCTGAIISEISGVASVVELWGSSHWVGALVAALSIVAAVVMLNYRQVEAFGIAMGMFELVFVVTMFFSRPKPDEVLEGMITVHKDASYWLLFSSNIGAVIMPWMIFFQQSAVVARRLHTQNDLASERAQTFFGSVLTQVVMIGALVTLAAAPRAGKDLKSVKDIQQALEPVFGYDASVVLISLAFIGSSLCGAVVVSLTAAWAICEAAQWEDPFSCDRPISEAPRFYSIFLLIIAIGAGVHVFGLNVVRLNVWIELVDSFLMPLVLCFLYLLVTGPLLTAELRVSGTHKAILAMVFSVVSITALATGVYGIFAHSF